MENCNKLLSVAIEKHTRMNTFCVLYLSLLNACFLCNLYLIRRIQEGKVSLDLLPEGHKNNFHIPSHVESS